jgi:hypothetical protein
MNAGFHRARTARIAAIGAAAIALAIGGSARAADGSVFPPNYTFPDGTRGFMIEGHAEGQGLINPCFLIGFGPGSGGAPFTSLDLTDPTTPTFNNAFTGNTFMLEWAVQDFGDGSVEPPPDPDNNATSFRHFLGGHTFASSFAFGPDAIAPGSWTSFNPQPEPPGLWFGVDFAFEGANDPWMTFQVREDGQLLSFHLENMGVPEPAEWSLLIAGFGLAGAALRRRGPATA